LWDNNGKNGLDAVGWVQVWINGNKLLTQGSDHTGDEISVDAGSKRIIALSVSYPVTSTHYAAPKQKPDVLPSNSLIYSLTHRHRGGLRVRRGLN
jgi:hypothetical protein